MPKYDTIAGPTFSIRFLTLSTAGLDLVAFKLALAAGLTAVTECQFCVIQTRPGSAQVAEGAYQPVRDLMALTSLSIYSFQVPS